MASILWGFFFISRYRRLASIAALNICFLCCIPQGGACSSNDNAKTALISGKILDKIESQNIDSIPSHFDELQAVFEKSQNSVLEAKSFLQTFVNEVNFRYGLNLTVQDACQLVRRNIHNLQMSPESQRMLLSVLKLFEEDIVTYNAGDINSDSVLHGWHWPNEWNWFGLNKKKNKSKEQISKNAVARSPLMDVELPGNCYIGGCELLAGSLLSILPVPGAFWLGGAMIGDGVRRIADGVVQLSDERRANPNYVPPKPPFY